MDDRLNRVAGTSVTDLRVLLQNLAQYREPNHGRSVVEILITVVPFFGLWSLMWLTLHIGYGLYLLLAVPTAGFLVRLFDIGKNSFHVIELDNRGAIVLRQK